MRASNGRSSHRLGVYLLDGVVGGGATAVVWRGRRVDAQQRPFAIKRLRTNAPSDIRRLVDEATALARLEHPHIVRVVEVVDDGGRPAIVMPYAAGGSLADLLGRRPLTPGELVAVATAVAEALTYAHARNIVHGDVKPSNILLTSDGAPQLCDFGAAPDEGTDPYTAPEVVAGWPVGPAADIYALGVLCGQALDSSAPAAPALTAVIERARSSDVTARFSSAADVARALRAAVPAAEVRWPRPAPDPHPLPAGDRVTRPFGPGRPVAPISVLTSRRRWLVASAAGSVCALGLLVVLLLATRGRSSTVDCPTTTTLRVFAGVRIAGDTDGDGCLDAGHWFLDDKGTGGLVVTMGGRAGSGSVAYVAGRAGDVPVLGDWNCDGVDTLSLYRPSTGEVFTFDEWPASGPIERRAVRRSASGGRPRVVTAGRCDRLVVDAST